MAEESFPVLEKPMTDSQWKSVARGFGSGALDEAGNPYNLVNLNNATNQGTIAVDTKTGYNHAIVSGYYHKMDAPIMVDLPAVTSPTTYYIVLLYDPTNREKPVKLTRVTNLDRSGGKDYLVLWEVRRQPNQLLTDSVRTKKRPIVVPTIMVDYPSSLPEPTSMLWGTRAFVQVTNQEFRVSYNSWVEIGPHRKEVLAMPGWGTETRTGGIQVVPGTGGRFCTLVLALTRTAGEYWWGKEDFHTLGTAIPEGYRPPASVYALGQSGDHVFEVCLTPAGAVQVRAIRESFHFTRGRSFTVSFSWFVPHTW